jgi:hypothetical protein
MEFIADETGMRVGVWVPPPVSARAVAQVIVRCWPGARATVIPPPAPGSDGAGLVGAVGLVEAVCVRPAGGGWAPLIEPARSARTYPGQLDPLQSVLAALAERRGGERACAQLLVSPRRATGSSCLGGLSWQPVVRALVRAPFVVLFWVFDLLVSSHNAHSRNVGAPPRTVHPTSASEDPAIDAFRKVVMVKKAHGPHLSVTLRVSLSSAGSRVARRSGLAAIVNGYDVAAPEARLHTRRVRHPASVLRARRPGRGRDRFVVTLAEAAALWHLPAQPSLYGIPDASARTRRPLRDLPRFTPGARSPHRGLTRTGRAHPNPGSAAAGTGRDQWGPR